MSLHANSHTRVIVALVAVAVLMVGGVTIAKAETTTYECDYPTYSDEKGLHKVKAPFRLTFLLDASTKKAYLIGNAGSAEVSLIQNSPGLTLVEITGSGNAMVTAITSEGASVHSRSSIILGELVPSQYYGQCQRK
jgi:hypothetical protein